MSSAQPRAPQAAPLPADLAASYTHCRRLACAAARNFYYGISLLPAAKRDALCAIYAFMREADDISDSPGEVSEKQRRLAEWRSALDRPPEAECDYAAHPALPAFRDAVSRYGIPSRYLHDLISGTEMDLTVRSYPTFERLPASEQAGLREYCYRVAGCVGLTCLYVFGFRDPRAPDLAEKLGIAFQLTNILRDLPEDRAMGRVYIPEEDLRRFGLTATDLERREVTPAFRELMRFEAERAWQFYEEGIELLGLIEEDSRAGLWALARVYSGILGRIEARGYDVFSSRVSLSAAEKTWIMLRARLGWWPRLVPSAAEGNDVVEKRDRNRRRAGGALLGRRAG